MGIFISHTAFVPQREEFLQSKSRFLANIDVAMGGRAAEEIFFGNDDITTGCGSDLRQATYTAYRMLLLNAMGKGLITADLGDVSELKRAQLEDEVRVYLEVGLLGFL